MKRLLGLCALLFAGQSMAVCSLATFQGSYFADAKGHLANTVDFVTIASADVHGDGTAKVYFKYSLAGIPGTSTQNLTYTVNTTPDGSGNCELVVTATFAGIPVSFIGISGPSGDEATTTSTLVGATLYGTLKRTN